MRTDRWSARTCPSGFAHGRPPQGSTPRLRQQQPHLCHLHPGQTGARTPHQGCLQGNCVYVMTATEAAGEMVGKRILRAPHACGWKPVRLYFENQASRAGSSAHCSGRRRERHTHEVV